MDYDRLGASRHGLLANGNWYLVSSVIGTTNKAMVEAIGNPTFMYIYPKSNKIRKEKSFILICARREQPAREN